MADSDVCMQCGKDAPQGGCNPTQARECENMMIGRRHDDDRTLGYFDHGSPDDE